MSGSGQETLISRRIISRTLIEPIFFQLSIQNIVFQIFRLQIYLSPLVD